MIVCHINFSFLIGGVENMMVDILNEQSKTAKTSLIIVNNSYDQDILKRISDNVNIFFINRPPGSGNVVYITKLWLLIWRMKPNVIHCHTPKIIMLLMPFKSKCVYTIHNIGLPMKYLNKYKKLFAISKAVRLDVKQRGSFDSELVYNGINFEKFKKRTSYILGERSNLRIVQVSRLLHEQKGQDLLIRCAHKLIHNYGIRHIHVHIIGDGPSQAYLENLTDNLDLNTYVTFDGPKDRLWLYDNLSAFHILAQPSRFEGFGLTVLEAIAAGLPLVASNIDGPAEILSDVSSAFMYKGEDIEEMALKIKAILSEYTNEQIEIKCREAFLTVKDKFSVVTTANNYLKAYTKLN